MTQPATTTVNGTGTGTATPELLSAENAHPVVPGKRKRDVDDDVEMDAEDEEKKPAIDAAEATKQKELIQPYFQVLSRYGNFYSTPATYCGSTEAGDFIPMLIKP